LEIFLGIFSGIETSTSKFPCRSSIDFEPFFIYCVGEAKLTFAFSVALQLKHTYRYQFPRVTQKQGSHMTTLVPDLRPAPPPLALSTRNYTNVSPTHLLFHTCFDTHIYAIYAHYAHFPGCGNHFSGRQETETETKSKVEKFHHHLGH